jgi:type II secretion system protein I
MKLIRTTKTTPVAKRRVGGFTLAEVLAALAFMAIVIPVALQALSISSRAGSVAQRKAVAARVAEKVLNEMLVTQQWQSAGQKGSVDDGPIKYDWEVRSATWDQDAMQIVTVTVTFLVQGEEYTVELSSLADNTSTLLTQ